MTLEALYQQVAQARTDATVQAQAPKHPGSHLPRVISLDALYTWTKKYERKR
ncbi:MAG: hypothetical protein AAFV95_13395 [Bacteroidota bacterium]